MTEVLTSPAPKKTSGPGLDRPIAPMISSAQIARRVRRLGRQVSEVYADIDTPLVMVVILKGATVFAADLLRSLSIPAELEFVRASSYPTGTSSNGRLKLAHMVEGPLVGRHVLLVEDIIDSGLTVSAVAKRIHKLGAAPDRGQDRLHRVCHPRPFRDRLRPRLRRAVSRAAPHLFADITSKYAGWKKAELHSHLDGAVRISTAKELSGRQGLRMVAPDDCPSQAEYIKYFDDAIAVMQTEEALERIAYELCVDSAAENIDYLEVRWAPRLHLREGLTVEDLIVAVCRGLQQGPLPAVA